MFIGDEDGKYTYHRDESRVWHPYRSSDQGDRSTAIHGQGSDGMDIWI